MEKYNTIQEAFKDALNEPEHIQDIIQTYNLNPTITTIDDVILHLDIQTLEDYLLKNTYIIPFKNGYAFFEQSDYENNDELYNDLVNAFGENENQQP